MAIAAYYAPLFTDAIYDLEFSISFQGIGLPYDLFQQYASMILKVNNSMHCDGIYQSQCYYPGVATCDSVHEQFDSFYFQVFVDQQQDYMRIPIGRFIQHQGANCYIRVGLSNVNANSTTPNQNIILGGMFFYEFQSVFTNAYTQVSTSQ